MESTQEELGPRQVLGIYVLGEFGAKIMLTFGRVDERRFVLSLTSTELC